MEMLFSFVVVFGYVLKCCIAVRMACTSSLIHMHHYTHTLHMLSPGSYMWEVASLALLRVKLENVHLKVRATCRDMTCRLGLSFLLRSHGPEVPETARASSAGKAEAAGRCDVGVCIRPGQSLVILVQALPHGDLHQEDRVQSW